MSAEYKNFYENLQEASMRLQGTIVMYEDVPYYIAAIQDGYSDGIFRLFLIPSEKSRNFTYPEEYYRYQGTAAAGTALDRFMETDAGKKSGMIRKHINSPKFNKFRPFDLGMCNFGGQVFFLERAPARRTYQGMTQAALMESTVTLGESVSATGGRNVNVASEQFRDTIIGKYPPLDEVLKNFSDPNVTNQAVAFHRNFAVVRGPMDLLFLAYKTDVVGFIDDKTVKLDKKFKHLREAINELSFNEIVVKA